MSARHDEWLFFSDESEFEFDLRIRHSAGERMGQDQFTWCMHLLGVCLHILF